jgi:phosphoribosyl 1,2-cyclic phosphodiesterase
VQAGRAPASLSAILVTHEHSDHGSGVAGLARRYGIPVHATNGTLRALGLVDDTTVETQVQSGHEAFAVGDIEVRPYPVPHDAREPCQYVFSDGASRLGLLTDAGHITRHIDESLAHCEALILECNHDIGLLENGNYPPSLKARVRGPLGHLDNAAVGTWLAQRDNTRLRHIVAAHLSEKNNTPRHVRETLRDALGNDFDMTIAAQDAGLPWRRVA